MAVISDLFPPDLPSGTVLKKGALEPSVQAVLFETVLKLAESAPFSHARTKSGGVYSAEMTSCGPLGWWSDRKGTRYCEVDPRTGAKWPKMPAIFTDSLVPVLANTEWHDFRPDACLINKYGEGAKMGLHQDKDELDFTQPIVTVSLGATADFLVGGPKRFDKPVRFLIESGDVLIMADESRRFFHGIRKIYPDSSPITGLEKRISLTFRKAT